MSRPLSVLIVCNWYRVLTPAGPLDCGGVACEAVIDHPQRVIWVSPTVPDRWRDYVVARAVEQAVAEKLRDAVQAR